MFKWHFWTWGKPLSSLWTTSHPSTEKSHQFRRIASQHRFQLLLDKTELFFFSPHDGVPVHASLLQAFSSSSGPLRTPSIAGPVSLQARAAEAFTGSSAFSASSCSSSPGCFCNKFFYEPQSPFVWCHLGRNSFASKLNFLMYHNSLLFSCPRHMPFVLCTSPCTKEVLSTSICGGMVVQDLSQSQMRFKIIVDGAPTAAQSSFHRKSGVL